MFVCRLCEGKGERYRMSVCRLCKGKRERDRICVCVDYVK